MFSQMDGASSARTYIATLERTRMDPGLRRDDGRCFDADLRARPLDYHLRLFAVFLLNYDFAGDCCFTSV